MGWGRRISRPPQPHSVPLEDSCLSSHNSIWRSAFDLQPSAVCQPVLCSVRPNSLALSPALGHTLSPRRTGPQCNHFKRTTALNRFPPRQHTAVSCVPQSSGAAATLPPHGRGGNLFVNMLIDLQGRATAWNARWRGVRLDGKHKICKRNHQYGRINECILFFIFNYHQCQVTLLVISPVCLSLKKTQLH